MLLCFPPFNFIQACRHIISCVIFIIPLSIMSLLCRYLSVSPLYAVLFTYTCVMLSSLCVVLSFLCRYLLEFGRVSQYVGYNAMDDFFPSMAMKPNPQCSSSHCRSRQEEHRKYLEAHPLPVKQEEEVKDEVVHEDNEWGKFG